MERHLATVRRSTIDFLQAMEDRAQAADLRAQGVSAEDAVSRIDLTQHESNYGDRVRNIDPRAVVRIYERLQIDHPM